MLTFIKITCEQSISLLAENTLLFPLQVPHGQFCWWEVIAIGTVNETKPMNSLVIWGSYSGDCETHPNIL